MFGVLEIKFFKIKLESFFFFKKEYFFCMPLFKDKKKKNQKRTPTIKF